MEISAILRNQASIRETVLTDKESNVFPIRKGTKQGDPLSSLLFNTVLQYSLENNLTKRQENKKGIKLSDKTEDCLTKLRFADDVLLFSTSLGKLRDMLCNFKVSTEAVGLGIHPDKTKILSSQDKVRAKEITVDNIQIEILRKGENCAISWTKNHVRGSRNRRGQKQAEGSVGSVPQVPPGVDFERLPTVSQTSLI